MNLDPNSPLWLKSFWDLFCGAMLAVVILAVIIQMKRGKYN